MLLSQITMRLAGALRACAALCVVLTCAILVDAQQTETTLTGQQPRPGTTQIQPPTTAPSVQTEQQTTPPQLRQQTEPAQTEQQQQPAEIQQQSTPQTTPAEQQSAPAQSNATGGSASVTSGTQSAGMQSGMMSGDIVETAMKAGNFNTLAKALEAAGLVETLKGGTFTVFAPTDEAFAELPAGALDELLKPENRDKLRGILTYHVVSGKLAAADLSKVGDVSTAQGSDSVLMINAKDNKVTVNKAMVTRADVMASNGVIHAIDTVLMPRPMKGMKMSKDKMMKSDKMMKGDKKTADSSLSPGGSAPSGITPSSSPASTTPTP